MPAKAKAALTLFVTFWLIGLVVWPGCATPPLPPLRRPIAWLKKSDFKSLNAGKISRTEIITKLGEPDEYFSDLRTAVYRINRITGRKIWLCLGVIPVMIDKFPGGVEVALIQFDEQDRAQRFTIRTTQRSLRSEAEEWINANGGDKHQSNRERSTRLSSQLNTEH